jgi:HupE / UreJ protein
VKLVAITAALVGLAGTASAHKPSDAHVQLALSGDRLDGTVAIALRDLDGALDLDANGDGAITWNETLAAAPRIATYARERLQIAADGSPCSISFGAGKLSDYSDGAYWSMPLVGTCSRGVDTLTVKYSVLFDIDAQHRGIIQVRTAQGVHTSVARDPTPIEISVGDAGPIAAAGVGFLSVWTNVAALVCLVCLVLPALIDRRAKRWVVAPKAAAIATIKANIVAFALGSAATMLAATVGVVALPEHAVTLAVILTVAVAGSINFVRPSRERWDLAFELGLLHGLAASFVLAALVPERISTIVGFVTGVVAAEIAVAAVLAAALYTVRGLVARRGVLWAWSGATTAIAIAWACWIA